MSTMWVASPAPLCALAVATSHLRWLGASALFTWRPLTLTCLHSQELPGSYFLFQSPILPSRILFLDWMVRPAQLTTAIPDVLLFDESAPRYSYRQVEFVPRFFNCLCICFVFTPKVIENIKTLEHFILSWSDWKTNSLLTVERDVSNELLIMCHLPVDLFSVSRQLQSEWTSV